MKGNRGSTTIVVMTVLLIVTTLVLANGVVIHHLRAELGRIERQQQAKFPTESSQKR